MSVSAIVQNTIRAAVLSAVSNFLAQLLSAYTSKTAFHLDTRPILQFIIFTILNTPPNYLWQHFLEDFFPGYDIKPAIVAAKKDGPTEKGKEIVPQKRINVRNTLIKFSLDQTIGAVVNTVIFVGGMAALRGERDTGAILRKVQTDTLPLMLAGYKLWPLVSLLSFTVVPVQYRLLFGNLVGMGWGIFLSLFANH